MSSGARGSSLRWAKFAWKDWASDEALRMCSLAARGLWMELLCLAAKNGGYVLINGKKPTIEQISRLVGEAPATVQALVDELLDNGVMKVTSRGAWYSKRMTADNQKAKSCSEAGKIGAAIRYGKGSGNSATPWLESRSSEGTSADDTDSQLFSCDSVGDLDSVDTPPYSPPPPGGDGQASEGKSGQSDKPRKTKQATNAQQEIFRQFYEAYPRKEAPAAALKAMVGQWNHIEGVTPEEKLHTLGKGLRGYLHKIRTLKVPYDKIAHPATWLNQHRWLDSPMEKPKPVGPNNSPPPMV